jgi:hypothetical protein
LAYLGVVASEGSMRGRLVLLIEKQNSYRESRIFADPFPYWDPKNRGLIEDNWALLVTLLAQVVSLNVVPDSLGHLRG